MEYTPDSPPTKRLKTLSSGSPSPSLKGKSKIEKEEDDDDDSLPEQQLGTCGVCLLEEGMSLRGLIDSCEHYFCFVCIMEWAKVESRCPVCKRRFSTIRRPPKDGLFFSERIVNVPVRDQVYSYNGNATIGPSDLYSQVKCSICSLATDEELLLLCDMCDSAAHSYCVGLGATVPEGDWFCQDCTLSRDEHAKVEPDATCDANICPSSSNKVHFTSPQVSINDIVRETSMQYHEPDTSSVVASSSQRELLAECSSTQPTVDCTSNARTLRRCLNVHARIKVLRENWEGFRGGSLNFSSSFGDRIKASQPQTSSSNQESTSQKHPDSNVSPGRGPYNIDKAWKMMDIAAKALGRKRGDKSSKDKVSKHPVKKESLPSAEGMVRPNSRYFEGLKKNDRVDATKKNDEKHRFQMLDKNKPMQGTAKSRRNHVEHELPSCTNLIASGQVKNHHYNSQNLSRKHHLGATSNVVGSIDKSSHLIRPPLMTTDKCCAKKEIDAAFEEKRSINKDPQLDRNIREVEDAKKVDVFKEVARHATHSILGACGIERPRAGFRSFQGSVCKHNETHKRPRSTLMPTSCRECFFVFVKDVVTTIAFDRYK
ncbi:Zinc finger, FYVE/PHD-type [Cynara cardunculus var. scolymus]|uniref:Zinc finger, FYVE/PHD-type n=1 Tax=Cynara cardunculus var. scolymus TaxID=59895 RepID=A0A118K3U5_CYNCS|nr:Zinc finger, FYVE/PHD-type [Cynara cardunculus var. scolymus]